jgi:D-3-phosphoglycerate dehydrogenase
MFANMDKNKFFVIDFDSTFTKVEALDELGEISLADRDDKSKVLDQIKNITNQGMSGGISFKESLKKRLELLQANKKHLPILIKRLKDQVSDSIKRNKAFFSEYADNVFIISSGFKEFIEPIVTEYGIKKENIYANQFVEDGDGNLVSFNPENVLSQDNGKVKLLKTLNLQGDVHVIGDGYTDYEIRKAGLAAKFYAFTENVIRDIVVENADHVAPTFEEVLYVNKLPMAVSFPKNRIKVLILENIHTEAHRLFKEEGFQVEIINSALDEEELCEKVKDLSVLCIRSKTEVTRKVLDNANRLMAIGAFCIGTNQIDLKACQEKGIAVFNAPYSNTRSVVELAIGEIIMLMRQIPDRTAEMHRGVWSKTATGSFEVRGKSLGIIGYGNIGTQLSVVAEALGMKVYYYDIIDKMPLGNATQCKSLEELLQLADVVTLHVDGRKSNTNMIGEKEFELMKKGVIFLNLARGHVVDIEAFVKAVKSGKVAGAGFDVFPYEPKNNKEEFVSELRSLKNVILTPHIGGSTAEAQFNIAAFVPDKIISYINTGNTFHSVNFPAIQLPRLENAHRLIHVHRNVSGILAQINNVLAKHGVNIMGQYLKTNDLIGYVITDIDKAYSQDVIKDLKGIENTIKFRVLY